MKVVDHLEEFEKPSFAAVTIGTFDGVHIGHQAILKRIVEEARVNNGKSVLITLWPHPRFILNKDADKLKLLSTFEEKVALVKELGVDFILKIAFTPEFSNLSADEFVQQILVEKVGTKKLFIGYDHHFGNNREGNIDFLKERSESYGFEVSEISRQDIDDISVSSTKIRKAISSGDLALTSSLLGRKYSLQGTVVHGQKRGRSIGFPTANIKVNESFKLWPGDGVYAVTVFLGETSVKGMLNIGFRPTLGGSMKTMEVHLLNFEGELYDQLLKIEFEAFVRPEKKFDSLEGLKNQLQLDKEFILNRLK